MFQVIKEISGVEPLHFTVTTVAKTREQLRWYLTQEDIKFFGNHAYSGEMYTKNGDAPKDGHPIYYIVKSDIVFLEL